jgi:hypothetical protein
MVMTATQHQTFWLEEANSPILPKRLVPIGKLISMEVSNGFGKSESKIEETAAEQDFKELR